MGASPSPPASPSRHQILAEALRVWGESHPFCMDLLRAYPEARPGDPSAIPGIHVEAAVGTPTLVKGILRVSLLRVYSLTRDGLQVIAQVHGTQTLADGATPQLRLYVHDAEAIVIREVHGANAWWIEVLDRHYGRGGEPLALPVPVAA